MTASNIDVPRSSKMFGALGNETRLKILVVIKDTSRPLHIKAVSKILKIDYSALYRHIQIMQESGLIDIFEVGRSRVLHLKNKEYVEMLLETANKML